MEADKRNDFRQMNWQKQGYKYWHLMDGGTIIAEVAGYANDYPGFIGGKWIGSFKSEQQAMQAVNNLLGAQNDWC